MAIRQERAVPAKGDIEDFPFLHGVYHGAGINTALALAERRSLNFMRSKAVAEKLIEVIRNRQDFPVLDVPDPAGRLESVSVTLGAPELWRVHKENQLRINDWQPSDILEFSAKLLSPYSDIPEAHRVLGSISVSKFMSGAEVTEVTLSRPRDGNEVIRLDASQPEKAHAPEVVAFVDMVGNYLEQL
jgi:hypothetical protein